MVSPDTGELKLECNCSMKLAAGKYRTNRRRWHSPCPFLGFTATGARAAQAAASRNQSCHRLQAIDQCPVTATADKITTVGYWRWMFSVSHHLEVPVSSRVKCSAEEIGWSSESCREAECAARLLRVCHHTCPKPWEERGLEMQPWGFSWMLAWSRTASILCSQFSC